MPEKIPAEIALEFAYRMAARAKAARDLVARLERTLAESKAALVQAQRNCPHFNTQLHEREAVDDKDWVECVDCGAEIN